MPTLCRIALIFIDFEPNIKIFFENKFNEELKKSNEYTAKYKNYTCELVVMKEIGDLNYF